MDLKKTLDTIVNTKYLKLNQTGEQYKKRFNVKQFAVIISLVLFILAAFVTFPHLNSHDQDNDSSSASDKGNKVTNTDSSIDITDGKSDSTSSDTGNSLHDQEQSSGSPDAIGVAQLPAVQDPNAPNANKLANGYKVETIAKKGDGTIKAVLQLIDEPSDIYGYDFQTLNLQVEYQSEDRVNVKIEPTNLTNVYIVPDDLLNRPIKKNTLNLSSSLEFSYEENPFTFTVKRKSNNDILFSTLNNPLVFSNQFIQLNTTLPQNHNISGLGESFHKFISDPGSVRTIYANDKGNMIDGNIYGTHPVYYDERVSGAHAVYWRSSAIQEVVIEERSLTWRALGGIVDLYIYAGPTQKDAISQFVSSIGLPALQPYWALGYHQCKWGYKTIEEVEDVVHNFKKAGIPLETMWSDIDFMHQYRDFTNDEENYPLDQFRSFIQSLHDNEQHYVPIVDAAIYYPGENNTTEYPIFNDGLSNDVYLKNPDGSLYVGRVWPGHTVFPDFLANQTKSWWTKTIKNWYQDIQFDGIWLDMNEAASFCVGSCGSPEIEIRTLNSPSNIKMPGKGNINYPPYAINNIQDSHDLASHCVGPNATHFDGTLEYDVHNLYGYSETKVTYDTLLEVIPDKRPFILSRSTHTGSGRFAAHWGGDNGSQWYYMYFSISQALSFGMYGVPFFGVDACGFGGNSNEELCSRWMQLASFFPFYRNHNSIGSIAQEPYVWRKVAEATRSAMEVRYALLPYYYTLLNDAHETGVPPMRALSWIFPDDPTLIGADRQFFVGDALLVTPVLEPGVTKINGVFPGSGVDEVYYEYYALGKTQFRAGFNESVYAPLGYIPLHIRGGHIIPTQTPGYTIAESRQGKFELIVALSLNGTAEGHLYLDDGESLVPKETLKVEFKVVDKQLTVKSVGKYYAPEQLHRVTVLGVSETPNSVTYREDDWDALEVEYCLFLPKNGNLIIDDLEDYTDAGAFTDDFTIKWG